MAYTNDYSPTLYSDKDTALTGSDEKKLKGSDFSDGTNGDFDRIRAEFVKIQSALSSLGTTRGLFASCTFEGGSGPVNQDSANNVESVTWPVQADNEDFRFARVQFASPIPGSDGQFPGDPDNGVLDVNVNIQVTPFSNANNSLPRPGGTGVAGFVTATITNIDKEGCEIAFTQLDSSGQQQCVWYQAFCLIVAVN